MQLYSREIRRGSRFIANDAHTNPTDPFSPVTHHFIKSPDGHIRRFPEDHGTQTPLSTTNRRLRRGRALQRSRAEIYDAPVKARALVKAEFRLDAAKRHMTYVVNGKNIEPLSNGHEAHAYPLGNGKWMIPQLDMRGCTYSCEAMLAAEGKSANDVARLLRNFPLNEEHSRRETPEIISSIRSTTGREPDLQQFTGTSERVLQEVALATAHRGAGMLIGTGHARIIDGIVQRNNKSYVQLRDPFHGSHLEVKDHEQFWNNSTGHIVSRTDPNTLRNIEILFLSDTPSAGETLQAYLALDKAGSRPELARAD